MKWKRIGQRSYELTGKKSQAFVFGAQRPTCLWALSVYWRGGHFSRVENGFAKAKIEAEKCVADVDSRVAGGETPKPR